MSEAFYGSAEIRWFLKIELTKIDVKANGSDWLIVDFEAFGPSGHVIAILDEAIEHFFKSHGSAPV